MYNNDGGTETFVQAAEMLILDSVVCSHYAPHPNLFAYKRISGPIFRPSQIRQSRQAGLELMYDDNSGTEPYFQMSS